MSDLGTDRAKCEAGQLVRLHSSIAVATASASQCRDPATRKMTLIGEWIPNPLARRDKYLAQGKTWRAGYGTDAH